MREAGEKAGMTIEINPKMLRHACGFGLAERGAGTCLIQDFLGHRNARHTKKYTESDDSPFIDLCASKTGTAIKNINDKSLFIINETASENASMMVLALPHE